MFILSVIQPTVGVIGDLGVPDNPNLIISGLIQLAIATAGLLFFFMLIVGGLKYLSAGGDEKATAAARSTLTQAFIGLIIVIAAFVLTQLLFTIFKVPGIQLGV
jgi:hypothetical protein